MDVGGWGGPVVFNASREIANANYPDLRLLTVKQNPSLTPLEDITPEDSGWQVRVPCSNGDRSAESLLTNGCVWTWRVQPTTPTHVGGPDWNYFSAVCYLFGRDIHLETKVPVGLVASDYGGTIIEAWSSPGTLAVTMVVVSGAESLIREDYVCRRAAQVRLRGPAGAGGDPGCSHRCPGSQHPHRSLERYTPIPGYRDLSLSVSPCVSVGSYRIRPLAL